jgi:hypothetical protein
MGRLGIALVRTKNSGHNFLNSFSLKIPGKASHLQSVTVFLERFCKSLKTNKKNFFKIFLLHKFSYLCHPSKNRGCENEEKEASTELSFN